MIVEIHRSGPAMAGTLRYNMDKVRRGVASVLCTANMDIRGIDGIVPTFEIRERGTLRDIRHLSFQMSVNPSPDDSITECDIPHFVEELMNGLGYGRQPWVVFRHDDIGRTHYHVVSIRADENGRKIPDYFEKRKCDRLVEGLAGRYRYTKGIPVSGRKVCGQAVPVFEQGTGNVIGAISRCIEHSLSYRFTTERQFSEILRAHGVRVQEGLDRRSMDARLSFQGLDASGKPCTASVSDAHFGYDVYGRILERMRHSMEQDLSAERHGLRVLLAETLRSSAGPAEVTAALGRHHVDVAVYRDSTGTPRGATLIDHRSMCAFRCSEVSRMLASMLLASFSASGGGEGGAHDRGLEARDHVPDCGEGASDSLKSWLAAALYTGQAGSGTGQQEIIPRKRKKRKR